MSKIRSFLQKLSSRLSILHNFLTLCKIICQPIKCLCIVFLRSFNSIFVFDFVFLIKGNQRCGYTRNTLFNRTLFVPI